MVTCREASSAAVAARIATVFPAPTSPVMTPMWCCSMHQVIRATASAWERWRCSMGTGGEERLVVGLKKQAHHLADQFVRPTRQPQRARPPMRFGDRHPPDGQEPIALVAHRIDDAFDLAHGHAVHGFPCDPGRHRTLVGVDPPVGQQIQLRVEQLPIQLPTRQMPPAAVTQDTQHRFGVLHFAYLPVPPASSITWPPCLLYTSD